MKVKPPKCRSLAYKVFRKGAQDQYIPESERRYSAYDPKLSMSGQAVTFLGDEPFKFLGRKMSLKKDSMQRSEIKDGLIKNLETADRAKITGTMKLWLYNHFIVAFCHMAFYNLRPSCDIC